MDDEVVDDHGLALLERTHEGEAVLGIERAVPTIDAVRDGILPNPDIGDGPHP